MEIKMSNKICSKIRKLIGQGEYLSAYDLAMSTIKDDESNQEAKYLAVLSLARSGAVTRATNLFDEFEFAKSDHEDYAALGARLAKDRALNTTDQKIRTALLDEAAKQYHEVFKHTGGYYTIINAASLYLLSGNETLAKELATTTLTLCEKETTSQGLGEYYRLASMAEAQFVLGNLDMAEKLLCSATSHTEQDYAAMATTQRQLSMLLPEHELHRLSSLNPPTVIHYCGHMISPEGEQGRFLSQSEKKVSQAIVKQLDEHNVGFGYGSLASGADILFAEALLERGASLHIILPFDVDEFIDVSVKPAGKEWVARFHHCFDQANFISYSCDGNYLGDDILFHYATRLGMGLALHQARNLLTSVTQFAVWDGEIHEGAAGTYADIQTWQSRGHASVLINSFSAEQLAPPTATTIQTTELSASNRRAHAMLFGDIKGFSKLSDKQIPAFVEQILGTLGKALSPFESSILSMNTWGDGLFVVLEDALSAVQCAAALQDAMRHLDLATTGLPEHLALRLGGHYGPIYEIEDPILKHTNYFGAHVSKTARIEPITPEGEVYVTRQLAAEIELESSKHFKTEYVGIMPAAKKYGDMPMYLLKELERLS